MRTNLEQLERAIIKTVCYFDIFNIPLRPHKIKLFLYRRNVASDKQFNIALQNLFDKKYLEQYKDYCFLPGRKRIVKLRQYRKEFCAKRWHRAQKAAIALQMIPFIRLVAVTNSLALDNSNKNSDIDLFIVTSKGRLWTARILSVVLLDILGLNKNHRQISNQMCLGFFADTTYMDLSKMCKSKDDIYYTYRVAHMSPIYDKQTYLKFIEKNHWLFEDLPNFDLEISRTILRNFEIKPNKFLQSIGHAFESVLSGNFGYHLEKKLRQSQIKRIRRLEKEKLPVTRLDDNIMRLGAYNKNQKFNDLLRKSYSRFYNE
mgnify:CR=1 FL=1